jgi:hypothetical protein
MDDPTTSFIQSIYSKIVETIILLKHEDYTLNKVLEKVSTHDIIDPNLTYIILFLS